MQLLTEEQFMKQISCIPKTANVSKVNSDDISCMFAKSKSIKPLPGLKIGQLHIFSSSTSK